MQHSPRVLVKQAQLQVWRVLLFLKRRRRSKRAEKIRLTDALLCIYAIVCPLEFKNYRHDFRDMDIQSITLCVNFKMLSALISLK